MVGFHGTTADDDLRALISDLHVGGLILFKRNVSDPEQLGELCRGAQAFAAEAGDPPLIISIDQEGGTVARLGPPFTVFPGARAIGEAGSEDPARAFGVITARELKGVGINMDLAPVVDVAEKGPDSVMGDRTFSDDPTVVASFARIVIETLQEHGVAATAKHFPGIGRTVLDPHFELPRLETVREDLEATDLVPFRAAIESHVAAVMLSHLVYDGLDPEWPAGLSTVIARDLLRGTLGYNGLTMTDDLDMGAIGKHFSIEDATRRIVAADVDIVLICHDREKMEIACDVLMEGVRGSEQGRAKAVASAQRILRVKERYGP
jgi:beta-N-acetylhexosaminidase